MRLMGASSPLGTQTKISWASFGIFIRIMRWLILVEYALLGNVAKFILPVSQIYFLLCEIDTSPYYYLANLPS
jgi:hypothetical protein